MVRRYSLSTRQKTFAKPDVLIEKTITKDLLSCLLLDCVVVPTASTCFLIFLSKFCETSFSTKNKNSSKRFAWVVCLVTFLKIKPYFFVLCCNLQTLSVISFTYFLSVTLHRHERSDTEGNNC